MLTRLSKRFLTALLLLSLASLMAADQRSVSAGEPAAEGKIRVLLITGGHGFEQEPFFALFDSLEGVTTTRATYPAAADLLKPDLAKTCDVIVFYDMWARGITPEQQQTFLKLLEQGIGIFALHHTLGAHQDWPEYSKIIGGKFQLRKRTVDGKELPKSGFKHGVDIPVKIADAQHAITKGMKDFTIHDETYNNYDTDPDARILLITDEPSSDRELAWVKTYGKCRVFYLELGHDHFAYENPNFRQLIARGIGWTAGRL